tara:strand:- start:11 stop:310 length:300 start_codon:yes stop_codon:yes gene_type:complete
MVKLKKLLNENKGDLTEVKEQIKYLKKYLDSYEEGFKSYEKYFNLVTRNAGKGKLENMTVNDAKGLLKKHKELVVSQFNRQTYFTIENLIKELKKVRDD